MDKAAEKKKSDRIALTICFLLALIVWGVFGQTLRHEFVNYDDCMYVYENPVISKGVTIEGLRWSLSHPHGANWHPLTSLSHMLDCQIYKLNPAGHHGTNVLLHMATVILLFLVLRQMTGSLWRSAFVAAVFAIHPLRVESVAWVSERKDVLSGFFFMLTLGTYTRYARVAGGGWRVTSRRYLAVVLFFVLGLMSKAMLVTLPFVLLLLDFWPLKRFQTSEIKRPIGRLILEKIPLLLLAAVFCVVTIWAQRGGISYASKLPVLWRFGNAFCSYAIYIKQLVLPARLAPFYPHQGIGLPLGEVGASIALLAGISWGVFAGRKKYPYLTTGWCWYLGMLVPVIGIMQVGLQAHADRYTYLPQIGLAIMAVWLTADWCAALRHRRAVLATTAAVVLTVLAIAAHRQTRHWHDSFSLWTHALSCNDRNYLAHINRGNELAERGQLEEALSHLEKALAIDPKYFEIHAGLGDLFSRKGQIEKAVFHFEKALEIRPDSSDTRLSLGAALVNLGQFDKAIPHFEKALKINPELAEVHNDLGSAFANLGQFDKAIPCLEKALKINPNLAMTHSSLGSIFARQGQFDKAIPHFEKSLQIHSDSTENRFNLGSAFEGLGKPAEALKHYEKVLADKKMATHAHYRMGDILFRQGQSGKALPHFEAVLLTNPDSVEVQNNLAWILATCPDAALRDGPRAVELARSADRLSGGTSAPVLNTLAAAYAEAGQFPEAVATARRALTFSTEQKSLDEDIRLRLRLYEEGLPYHEPEVGP